MQRQHIWGCDIGTYTEWVGSGGVQGMTVTCHVARAIMCIAMTETNFTLQTGGEQFDGEFSMPRKLLARKLLAVEK